MIIAITASIILGFWFYKAVKYVFHPDKYIDVTCTVKGRRIKINGYFEGKITDVETGQIIKPCKQQSKA